MRLRSRSTSLRHAFAPTGLALALALAAVPGPTLALDAAAAHAPDAIVGAWRATFTSEGDAITAGLLFGGDGTLIVTSPDDLDGIALGAWVPRGDGWHATVEAYAEGLDGVMTWEQDLTLEDDGSLSSTGTAMLLPAEGEVQVREVSGTATRIGVGGEVPPPSDAIVTTAAGSSSAAIAAALDAFQAAFGADNGGKPGSLGQGFRRVDWEGVPGSQVAPRLLDPAFYAGRAAPRARGLVLGSPEAALQVSAGFGGINASYPDAFRPFSGRRLLAPLGTNVLELTFRQPGTDVPAVVRGFGAVFADVDLVGATTVELLDREGGSLGTWQVQPADRGLSFLGVTLPAPVIAGVRITLGTSPLGPTDGVTTDVVALDDLAWSEPVLALDR